MTKLQEKIFSTVLGLLLILSMILVAWQAADYVTEHSVSTQGSANTQKTAGKQKPCVVIDAGHGGSDPGKVGINNALEKDVNLLIAQHLQTFLEAADVATVMTREGDEGLYDDNAPNKKVQDMKRRIALIQETDPVLVVSIHQNSYHEEYVHGAQVFYYTGSQHSQTLAEKIQIRLTEDLDPENHRQVKANDSYYLLKKTEKPIVIVECGFLSNSAEAAKLVDSWYQEKIAWSIHLGILQYLNEKG